MSIATCAARCTASTKNRAPAACTTSAMADRSGMVPIRLEAPVTATSLVAGLVTRSIWPGTSSPVSGSKSAKRTVAPTDSAASTQVRTLASWSSRVTTTSSPGPQSLARVRARSRVSWVMLRPKTMPSGSAPSRSASADRAPTTAASALRSAAVAEPRFASGESKVSCTALATTSGVWVPPGPSKWAAPPRSDGKCARTVATSYDVTVLVVGSDTVASSVFWFDRMGSPVDVAERLQEPTAGHPARGRGQRLERWVRELGAVLEVEQVHLVRSELAEVDRRAGIHLLLQHERTRAELGVDHVDEHLPERLR